MKKLIVIAALALFLGAFATPDASAQHRRYGRGYHKSYHHGHYRHYRHHGYRRPYGYHLGYHRGHALSFRIGRGYGSFGIHFGHHGYGYGHRRPYYRRHY